MGSFIAFPHDFQIPGGLHSKAGVKMRTVSVTKKEASTLPGAGVQFPAQLLQSIASNSIVHGLSEKVKMEISGEQTNKGIAVPWPAFKSLRWDAQCLCSVYTGAAEMSIAFLKIYRER